MPVLIIEDDVDVARYYQRALATRGVESHWVASAEAALAALTTSAAEKPELILTDLNLPGRSGLELVRELKGTPALAQIPIVAVTADDLQWTQAALLTAGCAEFLVKPVLRDQLYEVVCRYLGTR